MGMHRSVRSTGLWMRLQTLRSSGTSLSRSAFAPIAVVAALRMLFDLYPSRFRRDLALQGEVLRAFVTTVIPGADDKEPDLIRMYYDTDYPFYPYTGFLIADLSTRALRICGSSFSANLSLEQRTRVIEDALKSDTTTSRLYRGAILMAQVSYYAGIYHPDRGCQLIDFPGQNNGYSLSESSYPWAEFALVRETTSNGHPR